MSVIAFQIANDPTVRQQFVQANKKETSNFRITDPLEGEAAGDQRASQ